MTLEQMEIFTRATEGGAFDDEVRTLYDSFEWKLSDNAALAALAARFSELLGEPFAFRLARQAKDILDDQFAARRAWHVLRDRARALGLL